MVGDQKASKQGLPRARQSTALIGGGLDWSAFFRSRPDLSPPGYQEAFEDAALKAKTAKQCKLEEQRGKGRARK